MEASLLIRLIDQVTGPAAGVRKALRGIKDGAGEFRSGFRDAIRDGFSTENIEQATRKAETALRKSRERLRGALAMGLALAAPIKSLGDFEDRLVEFGNTAGIYGDALKQIETDLRTVGPQVNKSAGEMLDALEFLVGKGMSPEEGMAALRAVGMTATATKADITDMSAAGFAAMDNLKVSAQDLQAAFDAMAQSGKSGGFELKGMAQFFPGLTASAQALGMKGVSAVAELSAALQIAMKGAGDESTAANNMQNFLSKLSSPETVKRFADMGIDIKAEFEKAEKEGVSVFEHMLKVINDVTGGDQFKMGELFGDQQVLAFLRPMMANMEEFRRIRDEAMKAQGVNEADFARVMETANAKAKAMVIELNNLLAAGSPLLDIFKELAGHVMVALRAMNQFAHDNPEATRAIVIGLAALLALSATMRVLSFAFSGLRLGLVMLAPLFLKFRNGRNIAVGWRIMAFAGRLLGGSLRGLARGVGLAAGALLKLVGIKPAWGLFSWLSKLVGLAGGIAALKNAAGLGGGTPGGTPAKTPKAGKRGLSLGRFVTGALSAFDIYQRVAELPAQLEESKKDIEARMAKGKTRAEAIAAQSAERRAAADGLNKWIEDNIGSPREWFKSAGGPSIDPQMAIDAENNRRRFQGIAFEGGRHRVGLGAAPAPGDDIKSAAATAASDIQAGGKAVADGGSEAGSALKDGAAAIRSAATLLSNAASRLSSTRSGGVGPAIQDAKAGALHGGTD